MNAPNAQPNDYTAYPDVHGKFGEFGGRYVAETLMPLVLDLEAAYLASRTDNAFQAELADLMTHYVGRGGNWHASQNAARAAHRHFYNPTYRSGLIGFRLCRDF